MSFDNALAFLPVALIVASAALMALSKPFDGKGRARPPKTASTLMNYAIAGAGNSFCAMKFYWL